MKALTLYIPDDVDLGNEEAAMLIATKLYEQGRLSLGQAGDVVGLTKRTFAEILSHHGVSIINYPASELVTDVSNA